MSRKRILTSFRLDKIAAVDRPCQEHATMAIMKRDDAGLPGPTPDERRKSMSEALQKQVDDLTKKVADLTKSLETSTSDLALAQVMAKMSDKEKDWHDKLKDEDAKKAFRDLSADGRAGVIAKAAEGDEVLKVDGVGEIRKSVVGEQQFALFKSQQDRLDQQAKDLQKRDEDIAKERDARVISDLRKHADDVYKHVAGTVDERAAMLKAISDIKDENVRKSFEAVLAQAEGLAKGHFETVGRQHDALPDVKKKADAFLSKAAEIRSRDKIGHADALSKARVEDPEGYKAYMGEAA